MRFLYSCPISVAVMISFKPCFSVSADEKSNGYNGFTLPDSICGDIVYCIVVTKELISFMSWKSCVAACLTMNSPVMPESAPNWKAF
jgi:hypothetical protein